METLNSFFHSADLEKVISEEAFASQFGLELPNLDASLALYTAIAKQRHSTLLQIERNVSDDRNFPKTESRVQTPNLTKNDAQALLLTMENCTSFSNSILNETNKAIEDELDHLNKMAVEIQENSNKLKRFDNESFENALTKCEKVLTSN